MANKTVKELDTKKTTVEAVAEKAPAKATTTKKAAAPKKETKDAEKKAPAKKATTTAKKTTEKKEEIFIQFAGFEFSDAELIEKVKANYTAETGKKIFKNVKLYVKPEEMMVYYVVNEKYLGKVSL